MRRIGSAFVVSILGFLLFIVSAGSARAQETTGTISGRIVDAQGLAVPGATVTITGQQGVKTVVADSEGRFSIPFLTPGRYTVHAELQGFKAFDQQNVSLGVGQTVELPVKLEVGNFSETVQVTVSADVVNPLSTTSGASLSSELLQRVPVGRDLGSTLYLAPGVSSSGTAGNANPSISGGSGLDNHYVIDGVNVTNQGYGALGSYSIIFGSLGNATPYDFIQEVQVKTGGYEAEFGQSTGGVVNVITKAGSNVVRGSAFGYVRPQSLENDYTQYQSINGSVQTLNTRTSDAGGEVGFPIVKDRLFFFGAFDPAMDRAVLHAPDGFALASLGDVNRDRRTFSYSAKTTWQVNGRNRIDASFFGDPSDGDNGPQRLSSLLVDDTSSFSSLIYGGHNQTVRYNGALGSRWLLEGAYARALNRIEETPSVNTWRKTDETVTPRALSGGIGFYEAGNRSVNNQWSIKSTNIVGEHQIRYGYEFDQVNYSQINQRTGPTFIAPDGRETATGAEFSVLDDVNFGKIYRVTRANFNTGRSTDQRYHQFFVQDSWRVGSNLTINPGLRYEQETLVGSIVDNFTLKNNWAPRIGATYGVHNGDGKLYGSYGRYYARIPNDLAARALSADDSTSRADYFDENLTQPIPDGVETIDPSTGASITNHFVLTSTGADTIDPNAKMSYADEYQLGYEHEILPHTSIGVRYSYRTIGRVLEDVANAPMAAYDLEVPGLDSVEYILTNPSSSTPIFPGAEFLGAHFDDPVHKYHAVELTLNRRFANNWSALFSYRWSRLRGNFEGFYRDDNGQSDPGITSLYDFPTNDPSYTEIGGAEFGYGGDIRFLGDPNGILPLDRPHQIKLSGNYLFPIGLNLGVNMSLSSGAPLTPFAANPSYDSGGEIPAGARGSGIQTIDGFQTRTPFQREVSMQASYDIRFAGSRSVTLLADIFNVFNSQTVVTYDQWTELGFQVPNPDFGAPITHVLSGAPPQYQAPRQIRLGARFSF